MRRLTKLMKLCEWLDATRRSQATILQGSHLHRRTAAAGAAARHNGSPLCAALDTFACPPPCACRLVSACSGCSTISASDGSRTTTTPKGGSPASIEEEAREAAEGTECKAATGAAASPCTVAAAPPQPSRTAAAAAVPTPRVASGSTTITRTSSCLLLPAGQGRAGAFCGSAGGWLGLGHNRRQVARLRPASALCRQPPTSKP